MNEHDLSSHDSAPESFFPAILDHVLDFIEIVDSGGRRHYSSPSCTRAFGKPGENLFERLHPGDREQLRSAVERVIRTGERGHVRYRIVHDDAIRYIEANLAAIVDSRGEPRCVMVGRDGTDLRNAESKERLLAYALDCTRDAFCLCDLEGTILFVNSAFCMTYGYQEPELIGKNILIIDSLQTPKELRQEIQDKSLLGGWTGELYNRRKDGSEFPIELRTSVVRGEGGEPVALVGVARDITAQRQSQRIQSAVYRIARAAERVSTLDELYRRVHEIIGTIMPATNFYIALYDEVSGMISFPYFVDEVDSPDPPRPFGKGLTEYVLKTGKPLLCTSATQAELERRGEAELVGVPSPIWLGVPLIVENKPIGVMTVQHYTDASVYGESEQQILEFVSSEIAKAIERTRIDQALRKSEERYRAFVDQSSEGIWRLEIEKPIAVDLSEEEQIEELFRYGYLAECNNAMARLYGVPTANKIVGMRLNELFRDNEGAGRDFFNAFIRSGYRLIEYEACRSTADGGKRCYLHNLIGTIEGSTLYHAWGIQRDITAKKDAENLMKVSEEKYRNLFEESHDGILLCTQDGRLLDVNQSGVELFGYNSKDEFFRAADGRDLYFRSQDRKKYWYNLERQGFVLDYEFILTRKDGQERVVVETASAVRDDQGKITSYRRFLRDITERKMLEEELRQAQKMEGIGTLAGGIAHDFNNLLGIILGYTTLLEDGNLGSPNARQSLEIIKKTVDRGASLVRQLLTFARRENPLFESVNVNVTIRELVRMLEETFPKTIAIVPTLAPELPDIIADSSQLHQALLNLSVNSRDAMSEGYGGKGTGTLYIESGVLPGHSLQKRFPAADAGEYICIKVRDTGVGMDEATRLRMFEPFFTTKGLGKGTGLGLAVVYGVVNSHHGFVDVESERGRGTTFSLFFPVQPVAADKPAKSVAAETVAEGGNEMILIVEDEELLRELLKSVLEERGYHVLTAGDGVEGLEVYKQHVKEIALVLSDMGLPRLGGWEMFQKMREIHPGVAAILASGYFDPNLKMDMLKAGAMDFIQKPYVAEDIHRRIREIIDQTKVASR